MFKKVVILVCAIALFALGHATGVSNAATYAAQEMDISTRVERISYIPTHLRTDAEMAVCRIYREQLLK